MKRTFEVTIDSDEDEQTVKRTLDYTLYYRSDTDFKPLNVKRASWDFEHREDLIGK